MAEDFNVTSPEIDPTTGRFVDAKKQLDTVADGPWNATVGCTDWAEVQWKASYRGIPFAVHSDERTGGRRIHVHEFPDREVWANEDLGRRKQQVDVEAYVFGDKSDQWAEKLFAVCTSLTDNGVGLLFLPMRVPMEARCEVITSSWNEDTMGRLSIRMRFILEPTKGKSDVPTVVKFLSPTYLSTVTGAAAKKVISLARDDFESTFTGSHAHSGRKEAARMIQITGYELRMAAKQARVKLDVAARIAFNIRRIVDLADQLAASQRTSPDYMTLNSMVRTQKVGRSSHQAAILGGLKQPTNPLSGYAMRASTNQVIDAIGKSDEGFGGIFERSMDLLRDGTVSPTGLANSLVGLSRISTLSLRAAMQTSSARSTVAELDLSETVAMFVRRSTLAHQCLATIRAAPEKQTESLEQRKRILASIENEMALAAQNNEVWEGFRALRVAIIEYMAYWSDTGPSTVQLTNRTISSLASAAANHYPKNKLVDRDRQLMKLNKVRHPLHAPPSLKALKV